MNIKWTFEKCVEEAEKYKSRMEFKNNSGGCYSTCVKRKWLDAVCQHMEIKIHKAGHWTYERCLEIAKRCKTRTEFCKEKGWAYNIALSNGWIDEICSHMEIIGNHSKRCIYVYEFENYHAYVGLTYDFEKRWQKRLFERMDAVNIFMKETNLQPKRIQLTDYVDKIEAVRLEKHYFNKYKEEGWFMLNRAKSGSLGGNVIKWGYDVCL